MTDEAGSGIDTTWQLIRMRHIFMERSVRHSCAVLALALSVGVAGPAAQVGPAQVPQAPLRNVGAQALSSQPPPPSSLVELSGMARTSTNAPVPYANVRLRDAQTGRIVGTTTASRTGQFSFGAVRPGYYVVELVDQSGNVLTTSPLITANAGDVVSTLVKLPVRIVPGWFVGGAGAAAGAGAATANVATIVAVVSAAASAGVLAVAATRPVSPEK